MRRRGGFTLLEVCLVVVIALLLFGLAIPSIQGHFAEQRRMATFERFDDFARRAQKRAIEERRAIVLIWDGEGITMEPDAPKLEDTVGEGDYLAFEGGTSALERPAALEKNPAVEWMFWRSGTCEPVIIHYAGEAGTWSVRYDPLTVRAEFVAPPGK